MRPLHLLPIGWVVCFDNHYFQVLHFTASYTSGVLYMIHAYMECLALLSYCRIPFWSYAKLIATCWLVLPYFSGATYVYEHYVRPFYMNPQRTVNIWYVPRKKDIFSKPDDILTAAEKYIEENGPEAFENLISKVCLVTIFYFSFVGTLCSSHD